MNAFQHLGPRGTGTINGGRVPLSKRGLDNKRHANNPRGSPKAVGKATSRSQCAGVASECSGAESPSAKMPVLTLIFVGIAPMRPILARCHWEAIDEGGISLYTRSRTIHGANLGGVPMAVRMVG
jgi:hypothetical protein